MHKGTRRFPVTDFGAVGDSSTLNTRVIQQAIDAVAEEGGGIVVVPEGRFLSGAIFFKPGVKLHLEYGAVLLGSDNISDYPWRPSRIEGVTQPYYAALINAEHCDNFAITGRGKINGNGYRFWQAFWDRRAENPACTNLEVARPRLIYISHSKNITLEGVELLNSGFWTTHLYQCQKVEISKLTIFSPRKPLRAPSTDGIDLDVCRNVHISECNISVNDDAICIKGGKGIDAARDADNGTTENVLIENCNFGWNHSVLTLGSEAIACKNIRMQNCKIDGAWIVLRCKLRPDTPQDFQNIHLQNIEGHAHTFLMIKDWLQFFDDQGEHSLPLSTVRKISFENIRFSCKHFRVVECDGLVKLVDFRFKDMHIEVEWPDRRDQLPIRQVKENNLVLDQRTYLGKQGEINEL